MNFIILNRGPKTQSFAGHDDKTCFASKKGRNWERKWKERGKTRRLTKKKERKKKYLKM